MCGLKHKKLIEFESEDGVTPCMGVWIETNADLDDDMYDLVTPCMGVWIETYEYKKVDKYFLSHPVWVCGLKH